MSGFTSAGGAPPTTATAAPAAPSAPATAPVAEPTAVAPASGSGDASAPPEAVGGGAPVSDAPPKPAAEPAAPSTPDASPKLEAAPTSVFPSAKEFGWATWDGSADGLPEDIRAWYQRFESRFADQLEQATKSKDRYENMWREVASGAEDPRIQEMQTHLAQRDATIQALSQEAKQQKQYYDAVVKNYEAQAEQLYVAELERVRASRGAEIDAIEGNDELFAVWSQLVPFVDFEQSLDLMKHGTEVAQKAIDTLTKFKDSEHLEDVAGMTVKALLAEYTPRTKEARPPNPAAKVVAGASPTMPPAPPKEVVPAQGSEERTRWIAEQAFKAAKRR